MCNESDFSCLLVFLYLMGGALLCFGLVARYWVWPRLRALPLTTALQPLMMVEGFRYLGAVTLTPSQVSGDMPVWDDSWRISTAVGDNIAAGLALLTLVALRGKWPSAIPLAWTVALFGTADLVYSFVQAIRLNVPNDAGALIYIVSTIYAPAGLIALIMMFVLLRKRA